jgi:hypothetical protein
MQAQNTKLDFTNQDIYAGIDAGKKGWTIRILVNEQIFKPFTQPPQPAILANYLRRNFPGARYHAVYEAGYFGFWIYDALKKEGIDCIVVNPPDVPTTHKRAGQVPRLSTLGGGANFTVEMRIPTCPPFLCSLRSTFPRGADGHLTESLADEWKTHYHFLT